MKIKIYTNLILGLIGISIFLTGCNGESGNSGINQAPFANISTPTNPELELGSNFILDGSASFDPDGDSLTYNWKIKDAPADSNPSLINKNSPVAQITLHNKGSYTIELNVSDGELSSSKTLQLTGVYTKYSDYIPIGCSPQAIAIGDFNSDNRNDIALTLFLCGPLLADKELLVLTQNPDKTFSVHLNQSISKYSSLQVGDVNSDGRDDLILPSDNSLLVYYQSSSGGLTSATSLASSFSSYSNIYMVRLFDGNNDSKEDLLAIDWGTQTTGFEVFYQNSLNQYDSSITYNASHEGWEDMATGDLNNDGYEDFVITRAVVGLDLYVSVNRQNPSGGFLTEELLGPRSNVRGVAIGDINSDGRDDMVLSITGNRPNSKIVVYYQNADGTLAAPIELESYDIPATIRIGDVNGDKLNDIVVWHNGWDRIGVYLQTSSGFLQSESTYIYSASAVSGNSTDNLQIVDFDKDGFNDVLLASPLGYVQIWYGEQYFGN